MDNIIEIERVPVESSNVKSLGYNDERQIMALEMLDGTIYYYLDIPKIHFTEMLKCNTNGKGEIKSIGSYLRLYVYGVYRYVRVN